MSDDNGFVERPTQKMGPKIGRKYEAIVATADNGKAVRIALNEESVSKVQSAFRQTLKRHGYRLRYEDTQDGHITAWAERIAPKP